MSDFNFNKFNSQFQKDIDALGKKGAPTSQDQLDQLFHTFHVAKTAEKLFKKKAENTLVAIEKALGPTERKALDQTIHDAKAQDVKQEAVIAVAQEYVFQLSCNKPARRFNKDALRIALARRGWSTEEIDILFNTCEEPGEPAKTFAVVPIRS